MRKACCILVLLVLACAALAQQGDIPQLATSAQIEDTVQGTVTITGGSLESIAINLTVPQQTDYQQVQTGGTLITDSEGNQLLHIQDSHPSNPYIYSKQVLAQTSSRSTLDLPPSYAVPQEFSEYLAPTSRTESSDPAIREAALNAVAGSQDQFEKVARLAIFVNQLMTYNESLVGQDKDASWVLENKQGVCVEYSTLFAALARSIGIPTRYVTGYAYTDRFSGWLGHVWDEVYIGDWIPVDATWFEVGRADAVRIEETKSAEIGERNTVFASVSSKNAEISWDTPGRGARPQAISPRPRSLTQTRTPTSAFQRSTPSFCRAAQPSPTST